MRKFLCEEEEFETEWYAVYFLPALSSETDDSMEETSERGTVIEAPDFDTAYKYAEQYMRKQASEDESWKGAELTSLYKK